MDTFETGRRTLLPADLSKINFSDANRQHNDTCDLGTVRANDGATVGVEGDLAIRLESHVEVQIRPKPFDEKYSESNFRAGPIIGRDGRWELFHRKLNPLFRSNKDADLAGWLFDTTERIVREITKARGERGVLELSFSQPRLLLTVIKRGYKLSSTNPAIETERSGAFLREIQAGGERLESPRFYMPNPSEGSRFLIVSPLYADVDPIVVDKHHQDYHPADFSCTAGRCVCTNENKRHKFEEGSVTNPAVLRVKYEKTL